MRKDDHTYSAFREEAKRVIEFFSKKTLLLLIEKTNLSQKYLKELAASHTYLFIKSFNMHQLMQGFPFNQRKEGFEVAYKKHSFPSHPQSKEGEISHLSGFIEDQTSLDSELSEKRVHGWNLKEFYLAKKQFETLSSYQTSTRSHDIQPFNQRDSQDLSQIQEWQDFIAAKEERHFQITRITKILSS